MWSCGADIIWTLAKINTYLRTSTIPQMISYGFPIGQGNILDIFVLMYYISMKPVGIFRIKKYLICSFAQCHCGDFNWFPIAFLCFLLCWFLSSPTSFSQTTIWPYIVLKKSARLATRKTQKTDDHCKITTMSHSTWSSSKMYSPNEQAPSICNYWHSYPQSWFTEALEGHYCSQNCQCNPWQPQWKSLPFPSPTTPHNELYCSDIFCMVLEEGPEDLFLKQEEMMPTNVDEPALPTKINAAAFCTGY